MFVTKIVITGRGTMADVVGENQQIVYGLIALWTYLTIFVTP